MQRLIVSALAACCTVVSSYAQAPIPTTALRPSYNTGNGFFVVGRGIYDANGNLFTPIGANKQHYDSYAPDRFRAKPNVERQMPFMNQDWATVNKPLMDDDVSNKVVPIPAVFYTDYDNGIQTSGATDTGTLNAAVSFWTSQAANWTSYNNIALFNIANEWGPCSDDPSPQDYQTGYIYAVQAMRQAGYTAPIVVDASCSGEGIESLVNYAQAIEDADPLHNVVFSIHVYGSFYSDTPFCDGCGYQFAPAMKQLASLGVPVIIGEFGCANCDFTQPSPVPPDDIMKAGELYQFGWLAWSWDDNDCTFNLLGPCPPFQGYAWTFQLSDYGFDVITSPGFGMQAVSKPATVFQ